MSDPDDTSSSEDELMVFDWETRSLLHITDGMRKIFGQLWIDQLIGSVGIGVAFAFGKRLYPGNEKAAGAFYNQVAQTEKFFEEDEDRKQLITYHAYDHDGRCYRVMMNFVRIGNSKKLVFLHIRFKEISVVEFGEIIEEKRQFEMSRMRREA